MLNGWKFHGRITVLGARFAYLLSNILKMARIADCVASGTYIYSYM